MVLPAPLRPIRVTTSPAPTLMRHALQDVGLAVVGVHVLDGEQAGRARIAGRPRRPRPSPPGPVRWRTTSLARISSGVPSASTCALVQHGDAVGDPHHELHLVLDEHHGAPAASSRMSAHGLVGLLGAHARGGLVQEQQRGVGGQRDADLQMPFLAVREMGGEVLGLAWRGRPPRGSRARASRQPASASARVQKLNDRACPCTATRTFSTTVRCGKMLVIWYDLEMPRRDDAVLGQPGDVRALEPDAPRRRRHLAGDQAEERGLARAVRAR